MTVPKKYTVEYGSGQADYVNGEPYVIENTTIK
jgi:hypothetical protein